MKFRYLPIILLLQIVVCAQDTIPHIFLTEVPNCKITRESTYDGNSLWGYMDGAADTYLEYGFKVMMVQELNIDNHRYRVEIFKMTDAEAAFGIYSVSHYKQSRHDTLGIFNCYTKYQAQFPLREYYVSVVNDEGSEDEQAMTLSLALILKNKITGESISPPAFFRDEYFASSLGGMKFIRGRLGIQNGLPQLETAFSSVENYSFYAVQVRGESGNELFAEITFASPETMKAFCRKAGMKSEEKVQAKRAGNSLKVIKLSGGSSLLYYETNGKKAENGAIPGVLLQ